MRQADAPVLTVRQAPLKTVLLILMGLAFTAFGFAIALHWIPVRSGSFEEFIGWVALLFFGGATLAGTKRLVFERGPVLEIGPHGILYRRVSDQTLPWSEVESIHFANVRGTKFICFKLVPGVRERLYATFVKRYLADAATCVGYPGDVCIAAVGVDRSFEEVADAITTAWSKTRQRPEA